MLKGIVVFGVMKPKKLVASIMLRNMAVVSRAILNRMVKGKTPCAPARNLKKSGGHNS
jgi:hypothetical protein